MRLARRISSNMSKLLLLAAPSVPKETVMPRRSMAGTGAMPLASFKLLPGLWETETPRWANRSNSASVK
ncbi:hypothetical protein D3C83_208400 [compost metagenome]